MIRKTWGRSIQVGCCLLAVFALLVGPAGCGGGDGGNDEETTKVGFIYLSPPGDLGWTYMHDQGRLAVELNVDKVETKYIESVSEEGDAAKNALEDLKNWGAELIFTTSFGYMDATLEAAEANPDIKYEHCSGFKTNANLSNYFGRIYQSRFLTGIVAGRMTTANQIGYVAAFPIPEVVRGINAFTLGVRSVNPDATVHVEWVNSWYDPTAEGEKAEILLNAGADMMAQHQDSTATVDKAKAHDAYAIGYDSDMLPFATETVLTSAIWNWGAYYVDRVNALKAGTWSSQAYWGDLNDGIVDLGEYGAMVTQAVKDEVAAKRTEIEAGDWDVFDGEIRKQDGSVWIASGSSMTDEDKLSMQTFVEGVVGEIP